ncbi:saccharopine dehydrogenase family protein [Halioglobus pacificus]|nr:saccharopine dehydrogenase NADP-binding domain-containing protein [Halioglobus pacificus]
MKTYRLVVLGATGVTGQNTFRHLAEHLPADFSWAIAGRNPDKMKKLVSDFPDRKSTPAYIPADVVDRDSVDALIKNCDVLIHLAGPYATHGELFFEKCIEHRTHYVDIGGETFFIKRMIEKYHQAASDKNVILLPTAGYESVPFDLLTLLAITHLEGAYQEHCAKIKIVTSFHRLGGVRDNRISGGSIGTMRNILAGDDCNAFNDMACLLPPKADNGRVRDRNKIRYAARYDEDVQAFTGPLQPAPFLNVPVVLRSAHLLSQVGIDYGANFSYSDSMTMEFYADSPEGQQRAAKRSARINKITSMALAGPRPLRGLIRRRLDSLGVEPGDGPSQESLPFVDYTLRLFGESDRGRSIRAQARAKGHPGYLSTSKIVAEVGLFLAEENTRPPVSFGVVTPATALGLEFLPRLQRAGVKMEMCNY